MATSSTWTVVFENKKITKPGFDNGDGTTGRGYTIDDDAFWNQSKFSNIWAIQYGTTPSSNEVEYRDQTAHTSWTDASLGDFQPFIDRWDAAHLTQLQFQWDNDPRDESEKGSRPTSYSS